MLRVLAATAVVAIGLLSGGPAGQAGVIANLSEPFAATVFVPCADGGTGDFIDLSGNLHVLMTLTVNAETVSGVVHFQPQGVSGFSEQGGDVYEGTGVTREHFTTSLVNERAETSFVNSFQIIGRGGAANFRVHATSHVRIAANGDVAGAVDNVKVDCD